MGIDRFVLALAAVAALGFSSSAQVQASGARAPAAESQPIHVDLQGRVRDLEVVEREGRLHIVTADGSTIPGEQWMRALRAAHEDQDRQGFVYVLFNITTPWSLLWIAVGFAGQALFTLRMALQWYASEKSKRSIVPVGFWWGSLFGGILLLAYFVWRKDVVGVVGQSTGVFVYARNLVLIHRHREPRNRSPEPSWSATSSPQLSPTPTGRSTSAM